MRGATKVTLDVDECAAFLLRGLPQSPLPRPVVVVEQRRRSCPRARSHMAGCRLLHRLVDLDARTVRFHKREAGGVRRPRALQVASHGTPGGDARGPPPCGSRCKRVTEGPGRPRTRCVLAVASTKLDYDSDGEPRIVKCLRCGLEGPFDPTLPYVSQMAAFMTGHNCSVVLPPDGDSSR